MNTALYSELLSKCPAVAGKRKQTNPNGFAELEARRSRREQAGNMLVLLNGWWFLHTHSVPVPRSHQCGLSLWVVNLFLVLSTIPEKYHIHNSHLLYSWMAVRSMRVCGGAGGDGSGRWWWKSRIRAWRVFHIHLNSFLLVPLLSGLAVIFTSSLSFHLVPLRLIPLLKAIHTQSF